MTPREPKRVSWFQHMLNEHGNNPIPTIILWLIIAAGLVYFLFKGGC